MQGIANIKKPHPDENCPGSEHDTWEEAEAAADYLRALGYQDPRILPKITASDEYELTEVRTWINK